MCNCHNVRELRLTLVRCVVRQVTRTLESEGPRQQCMALCIILWLVVTRRLSGRLRRSERVGMIGGKSMNLFSICLRAVA